MQMYNRINMESVERRCSRCHQDLPLELFYRHNFWSDGLYPYCKKCTLAYQKATRDQRREQYPKSYRWKRDLVRHDYFACIDSPIKAYILGMLAADGNILAKYDRITLELSAKDASLLEMIRDEIVPGGAITSRHRKGHDYQTLAFVSHEMVKDLATLGITPAKSSTIKWPEKLPPDFDCEFILGYFDGDGSITYSELRNRRYPYLAFTCGSLDLLISIADVIEQYTGLRPGGPWGKGGKNQAYTIRAAGDSALAIDEWLHRSGLGLTRKRLENIYYTKEEVNTPTLWQV